MSEQQQGTGTATQVAAGAAGQRRRWWRGLSTYGVMVFAALVGIGVTSTGAAGSRQVWVWATIAAAYFATCVWHGWEQAPAARQRMRLVVTQALHWSAFVVAMHVIQTREVRGVLNDNAEGVTLLILLALGTFLAGVHAWSLPICLTGLVLALSIPLAAWIEQTAVLLIVLAAGAAALFGVVWLLRRRSAARSEAAGAAPG